MKLRTRIGKDTPRDRDTFVYGSHEDVEHDAMLAHALVQAMHEIEGTYADCSTAEDVRTFLHERADELMREWTTSEHSSNLR